MFQIKHPGLVRLSPCQYDEQAFFTESSTLVTEFVVQKTRIKRLYLETLGCGVVRVERGSTKNKSVVEVRPRCDCTVLTGGQRPVVRESGRR